MAKKTVPGCPCPCRCKLKSGVTTVLCEACLLGLHHVKLTQD